MINVWSDQLRHATEEEILSLIEGELRPAEARRLKGHLERCWTCRAERDRVEAAIRAFVDYRRSALPALPDSTERFLAKLRAAAAQPAPAPARPVLKYALAAAGLAAVTALSFWRLHQPPAVSAAEILRRVEQAESSRLRAVPDPVVRQRLEIRRRRSGAVLSVALERDPALLAVLAANRLSAPAALDGSLYRQFRRRATEEAVRETEGEDHVPLWRLEASAPLARVDGLRQASLAVRRADAHPVEETLTVQRAGYVEEFQIRELAYAVVPRSSLTVRETRPAVAAAPSPVAATLPPVAEPDFEVVEVDLHYALHRIGACQGETVTIRRDGPGRLAVEGVLDSAGRRQRVMAALQPWAANPQVRIRLVTPGASPAEPAGPVTPMGPQAFRRSVPVAGLLREGRAGQPPAEWMYQALRSSDRLLAEAFALRRLEETFPAARTAQLPPHAQWLIEQMVEDHLEGLRAHRLALAAKLRLVPGWTPVAAAAAAGPTTAAALLAESRRISDTVSGLIAAPYVTDEETARAVRLLGRQLPQLESTAAAYPRPSQP